MSAYPQSSTAGPDGPPQLPRQGLGFDVPPNPPPPDHTQPGASTGLDWATGELRTYGPDGRVLP